MFDSCVRVEEGFYSHYIGLSGLKILSAREKKGDLCEGDATWKINSFVSGWGKIRRKTNKKVIS